MPDGIKLITGNANPELAKKVSNYLNIPLTETAVTTFSDGEIQIQIKEDIRGSDAFVIQPTCTPVNHNIMELLLIIDALKRASARRITAVIPYYGYARQDRKVQPRVPISAKLVANLITVAGANRVLSIDLHAGQLQGFFDIPVDNLLAIPVILDYLRKNDLLNHMIVVSPDAGGTERARFFAKKINAPLAIVDKRRDAPNISKIMHVIGDVRDKDALLIDDMIDTAGTITQAALALKEKGAKRVFAAVTHGVLSGPAIERLNNSVLEKVIITDTIPIGDKKEKCPKIEILTVAHLLEKQSRESIKKLQ